MVGSMRFNKPKITDKVYSTQPVLPDHNKSRATHSGPLALFSFAFTTIVIGLVLCKKPTAAVAAIGGVAVFYGGIAQFVAGYLELVNGNSFSGTIFASYGALWVAKGLAWIIMPHITAQYGADDREAAEQFAIVEAVSAAFTWTLCGISINLKSGSKLLTTILVLVGVAQTLQSIGGFVEQPNATRAGGAFLVVGAVGAWYSAVAELVMEDGILLPVGPHSEVTSHLHPTDH